LGAGGADAVTLLLRAFATTGALRLTLAFAGDAFAFADIAFADAAFADAAGLRVCLRFAPADLVLALAIDPTPAL
jgi:hypothetical protein